MPHRFAIVLLLTLSLARISGAQTDPPSVFDLPRLQGQYQRLQSQIQELFKQGKYEEVQKLCEAGIKAIPLDPGNHYNLACALAKLNKADDAMKALDKAVDLGFTNAEHIEKDTDLESLRSRDDFKTAVKKAADSDAKPTDFWQQKVTPDLIEDGVATVTEANTAWDPRIGVFRVFFNFPKDGPPKADICKGFGETGDLLRKWHEEGTAAGNVGDLYDNHDSDHSNMNYDGFPQLTRIEFGDVPKNRRLHHGNQTLFLYNGPTLGNSSTALTSGSFWRSQPRLILTDPRGPAMLYVQYVSSHIYFYPEHRDHDPGHNGKDDGYGDVYSANTPYMIISQGSSGTDRVFMNAVAATMAAFRPAVKQQLIRTGTLMNAVQMIFRMSNKQVDKLDDYLTGRAHPTVFEGSQLQPEKMVKLAHSITEGSLPPMVQLKVVEEDHGKLGVDYFDGAERERIFDTPCAIARVYRTKEKWRRMVVSAEASKDVTPNAPDGGKKLTYHWVILRGDPAKVKIEKLNEAGSVAEIKVAWHEREPVGGGIDMQSNRVDIGVFVHNGTFYSAPAFVCHYFLDNEKRTYENERIQSIDYADAVVSKNYTDPALDLPKNWRDDYHYNADGKLTGWTRVRKDAKEEFTADGLLITKKDDSGKPIEGKKVKYVAKPKQGGGGTLEQEVMEEVVELK